MRPQPLTHHVNFFIQITVWRLRDCLINIHVYKKSLNISIYVLPHYTEAILFNLFARNNKQNIQKNAQTRTCLITQGIFIHKEVSHNRAVTAPKRCVNS
jgi:hypothetical protein